MATPLDDGGRERTNGMVRTLTRTLYLLVAGPIALAAALAMAVTVVPWLVFAAIALGVPALPRSGTRSGTGPARRPLPGRPRERAGVWAPVWPRTWAGMPGIWFAPALAVARAGAGLERSLAGTVLGAAIPSPYLVAGEHLTSLSGFLVRAADPAARRDAAYVLLAVPLGAVWTLLGLALSLVPALLVVLPPFLYPDDRIALGSLGSVAVDSRWRVLLVSLAGLAAAVLAAPLLRWLGGARARVARAVLGPTRSAELAAQASEQRARRAAAARVVVADHRRIERDLHDGAQAAVPVDVDVQVPERPPAPVESAAYFIVAEALSNVTKHARASRARVRVVRTGDRLVVEVGDDGVGGADPAAGSGLSGLADRAAALDGRLEVSSPPGGPTVIHAELPCGS